MSPRASHKQLSGWTSIHLSLLMWSGRNCQLGWAPSLANLPNSGHKTPSLDRPSEGLAFVSIHSYHILTPKRAANMDEHSAMPEMSSGLQAPLPDRVEHAHVGSWRTFSAT